MNNFCFNDELACRCCGYHFFMSEDHNIQFPTFCPECGKTEVFRAGQMQDDQWTGGPVDASAFPGNFSGDLFSIKRKPE